MLSTGIKSNFFNSIKDEGLLIAAKKAALWCLRRLGIIKFDQIRKHRIQLSKKLDILCNSTVKYGPFKGLKLLDGSWSGLLDRGSMLLGIYEKEVLESLANVPKKYNTLIDLGAADGYYGVGVLINNIFEKSICYELRDSGRETIKINASLNNVSHRVDILGAAQKHFYEDLPADIRENSILLIDIEGAEFDLIDKLTFEAFNKSIIFIELHEWHFNDGKEKLEKLRNDAISTHVISELTMGARDLSIFPELKLFSDTDRWLVCSEGRSQLMIWLRFDPQ